ncbi:MAG: hypothetical protein K2Q01_11150 [Rickettsiales bacterium]|nr:hypothetical protein [Rickettsiales bacterium]
MPNSDKQSAKRVCKQFLDDYQPILVKIDDHLQKMIDKTLPTYAPAYQPWLKALRDICTGVFLMSKGIALPDPMGLVEALKMFTFESTLQLLNDLCDSCKLKLKAEWIRKFREDIDKVLFAAATLNQQQPSIER